MTIIHKRVRIIFLITLLFALGCNSSKNEQPYEAIVPEALPPTASSLQKPLNNTVCEEGKIVSLSQSEVSFSWDAAQNTDTYELKITNLNSNTSITRTISHPTTTFTEILSRGIPYSWQIKSKSNKSSKIAESTEWKFYLSKDGSSNYAPFPATIVTPRSGDVVSLTDGKLMLGWKGSDPDLGSILSFQVYIDTSLAKVTSLDIKPIASTVDTTVVSLSSKTVYYWRVKTSDGQNSSFTIPYSFRTK